MPSPFPGMDPYIEGQAWEDFHHAFILHIREALVPRVRPQYVVRAEQRVYLEHASDDEPATMRPDVSILAGDRSSRLPASAVGVAEPTAIINLPVPQEEQEVFLTVRRHDTLEVVTVIELLSPVNKRAGSSGRSEYLAKRGAVLRSSTSLVELDLLRGGDRMPGRELPAADYYSLISRGDRHPTAEVYAIKLRDPLPAIPIPLAGSDPDVPLDLQSVFAEVYDLGGYDYALDYSRPVEPSLRPEDVAWCAARLVDRTYSPG